MMKFWVCFYLIPLSLLCACSSESPSQQQVIPIKGDPMTFVRGAEMDASQGLPVELFAEESEWMIYDLVFRTEPQIRIKDIQQAKDVQAATTLEQTDDIKEGILTYEMPVVPQGITDGNGEKYLFKPKGGRGNILRFYKANESLYIDFFGRGSLDDPLPQFKAHHYSVTPDQKKFSILFSFRFENADYLWSVYFIRKNNNSILKQTLNKLYNYLWGPGVEMAWNQDKPMKMDICVNTGSLSKYATSASEAIMDWEWALRDRLELVTKERASCPPFSDLNTQTVFHVANWIEVVGPMRAAAFVQAIPNYYDSEIFDADIFFLEEEWNEAYGPYNMKMGDAKAVESPSINDQYKLTMRHEFGHVLGLAHVFESGINSIMGYDGFPVISSHDEAAIQELYPKKIATPVDQPGPN